MPADAVSTVLRFAAALAVGAAGGAAFHALGAPLPWVLGSMAACAVASVMGAPIRASSATRRPMAAVIGVVLGSSFHPGIWAQMRDWIVPLACLPFYLLSAAVLCVTWFRRVAKFDSATAYFAGMPGGIAEMVLMGADRGADERTIGLIHGARIFLVVFTLPWALHLIRPATQAVLTVAPVGDAPFDWSLLPWAGGCILAGLALGRALRLPAWHLIGPLAVSAAVHVAGISDFRIPAAVVAAAQVGLGATIGCRFVGLTLPVLLRTLALAAGSTAILLGLTAAWAFAIAWATGFDPVLLTLGYSPGGLAEMSMVALGLALEPAFVIVHHLTRVVLVLVAAPLAFRPTPS